jgi:hypothetical protein
MLPAFHTTT